MMMPKLRLNLGAGRRWLQRELISGTGLLESEFVQHELRADYPIIDVAWDLNDLPWPWADMTFTRIEAWAVFEHLDIDLVKAVNECWRILRPYGRLHVKVPHWKNARAYRDPTHRWRYDLGVFDYFDPTTKYGSSYEAYTPYKWSVMDKGYNDEGKSGVWAKMLKNLDEEQWEEALATQAATRQGFIIWFTGRSLAGKSTLVRGLQLIWPNAVVVDDHHLWKYVWSHTYERAGLPTNHPTPKGETITYDDAAYLADMHSDFASDLAYVARVLADQGHMVFVDMVAGSTEQRKRIEAICKPYWFYVKREKGEYKTPKYEPPEHPRAIIDHDALDKKQALEKAVQAIVQLRTKLCRPQPEKEKK